ncbi:MAG: helix-turn-helix transcriptional regulator [Bacilli bacterium]|nr:helix-turn-helix transcriptional regulator [Bacilli bacterium]
MIIGKRLKEARIKKKMSQEELGNLLGVSKVSICGYEKGTRTPTMENFLELIEILDLEPDYVLGRDKTVVSEKNREYKTKMATEDFAIIKELKENRELYNKLCSDPKRLIELINKKLGIKNS